MISQGISGTTMSTSNELPEGGCAEVGVGFGVLELNICTSVIARTTKTSHPTIPLPMNRRFRNRRIAAFLASAESCVEQRNSIRMGSIGVTLDDTSCYVIRQSPTSVDRNSNHAPLKKFSINSCPFSKYSPLAAAFFSEYAPWLTFFTPVPAI